MSIPLASDAEFFADGSQPGYGAAMSSRFPVHDACEFHDSEFLRRLIFVRQEDSSSEESDSSDDSSSSDGESSGTDGEHDNAAAAAAVMGFPQIESSIPHVDMSTKHANDNHVEGKETENKKEALNEEKMELDTPTNFVVSEKASNGNGTPEKAENKSPVEVVVGDISPVKLNSKITEEATPNVELLAKLGVNISEGNHNSANIDSTEDKPGLKKKNKKEAKQKKRKEKQPSFYCPHNLDLRDNDDNTPIHVAIHARKIEHIRLLLEAGASCHRKCDGSAPIHTVISVGAITAHKGFAYEAAVLLQKHGVDLTLRDEAAHTPLYLAAVCNLPSIAGLILSDSEGKTTLNARSDRSGGRPLHAAAKFDVSKIKVLPSHVSGNGVGAESIAAVTQIFLNTAGIEVDAKNNFGRTPLHIAASLGNWQVVRLLLKAGADPLITDQRGFTPGGLAYKRGMPIPSDLLSVLGDMNSGIPLNLDASSFMPPKRDLIIDPLQPTFLICHELCSNHFTCPPINRDPELDVPPENVRRLTVLLDQNVGILRGAEFDVCKWEKEARRASMADILKIHEYSYIENINRLCNMIPDIPQGIAHLDGDTAISRWSFESALRAAGSVCDAVDRIMAGDFRNAFCAVRPPGHHAGPRGIVRCANDTEGSHGFCLLNNVAIGAAYARSMYRNDGIKKVAIVDFDVHHGNGTEEIIRQLSPNIEKANVRMAFASGTFETPRYKPWLDETDIDNVFFASAHGYGPRCRPESDFDELEPHLNGWFYPASGKSYVSESFRSSVEAPDQNEFLLSQTWTRMGEETRMNCCKVINVGLPLPKHSDIPGMQRVDVRDSYRKQILPHLLQFDPDIIFISAGFDGHKKDTMNYGYVGMVEEDYEWVTDQLVKVANTCCNGRIISVLEGGYKIHGGIVSPFARSVASHVRALVEGGNSRELYDKVEAEWESKFERGMVEERERRRQLRMERLSRSYAGNMDRRRDLNPLVNGIASAASYDMDAMMKEPLSQNALGLTQNALQNALGEGAQEIHPESMADDEQPRKRKRNTVDYKELYEQLKEDVS
jgi:acetoin utilization deacetylase AcuC-like enzyme/ankyrin repeat protein